MGRVIAYDLYLPPTHPSQKSSAIVRSIHYEDLICLLLLACLQGVEVEGTLCGSDVVAISPNTST
jgi:hypothetical protein